MYAPLAGVLVIVKSVTTPLEKLAVLLTCTMPPTIRDAKPERRSVCDLGNRVR